MPMGRKMVKNGVAEEVTPNNINELDAALKSIEESGNMDLQCIRELIEMEKRKRILLQHPYEPKYNEKKDRWLTRFNVDGKIVQKSKKTLKELEDLIVRFYTGEEEPEDKTYTFSKGHDKWMEMQKEYGKSNNSIRRYETDWFRFFDGTPFARADLSSITSKDIELFMINNIKKFNLKRRGADGLYSYISGVFYNAVIDKIIPPQDNPCQFVDKKKFVKFYNTDEKTIEERTLSQEELTILINKINSDILRKRDYIYPYGIQFALLTGMRCGEIAGLRWKYVLNDHIIVCESEKYDVVNKTYEQSKTKTGKTRTIPITEEINTFLNKMRDLQREYGQEGDFVFSFDGQKLRCKNLTAYMNHKCEQIKFDSHKSIHAIRRTFNSYLRFDGVSATEAGSLIGNTPRVNDLHYTYDIQNFDKKKFYMESAEKKMVKSSLAQYVPNLCDKARKPSI